MRVLHVAASLSPEWGGPPRVIASLTEALVRKGVQCAVFATDYPKGCQPICPLGVETHIVPSSWLTPWWKGHSSRFFDELKSAAPDFDLLHIHELWHYPNFVASRVATWAKKPYVVTIHGELEPWAMHYKAVKKQIYFALVQREILEKAAAVHVLTLTEARQIRGVGLGTQIAVIPNGVDIASFSALPKREEFEQRYPELCGKRVILFMGRVHPKKGLDLLAKAFATVVQEREFKDVRLVIAGPDEIGYRAKIEGILRATAALDKTTFTGMLTGNEKTAAFARTDVFVLPSYSEGFSMAVLEALACHLPVILTHACNFPEVAKEVAGEVITPDVNQLTSALKKILSDGGLRQKMGQNAYRLVLSRYNWDEIGRQMYRLYESLTSFEPGVRDAGSARR